MKNDKNIRDIIKEICGTCGIPYDEGLSGLGEGRLDVTRGTHFGCPKAQIHIIPSVSVMAKTQVPMAKVQVTVTWPSNFYTPAEAVACAAVHTEAAQIACLAESIANDRSYRLPPKEETR